MYGEGKAYFKKQYQLLTPNTTILIHNYSAKFGNKNSTDLVENLTPKL